MNIGIFGDSYAVAKPSCVGSWQYYLKKLYGDSVSIENFGVGGSSLYYSYKNFLKRKDKFNTIIFIATEPHRYPIPFMPKLGTTHYIVNYNHTEQIYEQYKDNLTDKQKNFLQDLKGWFNASNEKYNDDISDIIIQQVLSLHNNILLYPSFINSLSLKMFDKINLDPHDHPMHSFWYRQLKKLGIDNENFTAGEKVTLNNHLTPEYNEFIANVFYKKLTKNIWDFTGIDDINIQLPKTHYYSNWD